MTFLADVQRSACCRVMPVVLWLVVGVAAGTLNSIAGAIGLKGIGLGWSLHPGWPMICLILLVSLGSLLKVSPASGSSIGILLTGSTAVEFLRFPREVTSLFGIFLVLMAEVLVFRATANSKALRTLWFACGSYIQSVFIYNLLLPGQKMQFFAPGWTL